MRNLKRALSLALASVMLLGMMVVGSGAVSYNDADDIENVTAVEVLKAISVMSGDDKGNFNPDQVVTRAEMAVIICNILYGDKLNISQFAGTSVFSDVPAWAQGYVNLAASLDIVAGVGDGKFDPNAPVTTAQATLMLCKALGYFQNPAEFGSDWALAAITRGTKLGLFGDLRLSTNEGLTRDNVAALTFNTLTEAVPVMYNETFDIYYNDSTAWTQGVNYDWTETLGYKNFDLVYDSDNGVDDFGRPTTLWGTGTVTATNSQTGKPVPASVSITKDNEIITVPAEVSYTFQGKVTAKTLYDTIGNAILTDTTNWDMSLEVDGESKTPTTTNSICDEIYDSRTDNDTAFQGTGVSSLTEVFLDAEGKHAYIAITNLYAAEVTRVRENDDGEFIATLSIKNKPGSLTDNTIEVAEGAYEKDDVVVVTVAADANEVKTIAPAEKVSGEVTAVKSGKYIKVDGNQYDAAAKYYNLANNDTSLAAVDTDVVVYLDTYGNMIAADTQDASKDYLYVVSAIDGLDGLEAKVVFADGTEARINIVEVIAAGGGSSTKGEALAPGHVNTGGQRVFTYTVDGDEYTLTNLGTTDQKYTVAGNDGAITKGSASILVDDDTTDVVFTASNKTVFVDVENNKVYTGYQNVPSFTGVAMHAVKDDGLADIVFITAGVNTASNDMIFYVKDASYEETKVDGATYREYTVYVNGEEQQLTTKNMTAAAALTTGNETLQANTLYVAKSMTDEGYLTGFDPAKSFALTSDFDDVDDGNVTVAKDGVLTLTGTAGTSVPGDKATGANKATFTYDDNTVFMVVTDKEGASATDTVEVGSASDIVLDGTWAAAGDDAESVVYILSVEDKDDDTPLATLVLVIVPQA